MEVWSSHISYGRWKVQDTWPWDMVNRWTELGWKILSWTLSYSYRQEKLIHLLNRSKLLVNGYRWTEILAHGVWDKSGLEKTFLEYQALLFGTIEDHTVPDGHRQGCLGKAAEVQAPFPCLETGGSWRILINWQELLCFITCCCLYSILLENGKSFLSLYGFVNGISYMDSAN